MSPSDPSSLHAETSWRSHVRPISLTLLLMLGMVLVRVLYGAITEVQEAERLRGLGELNEAITHYERAIHWHLPVNPWEDRAVDALLTLGAEAKAKGDSALALRAYEALRSGIYATRSVYVPHAQVLTQVNQQIAALQVQQPDARWPDPSLSPDAREAIALKVLERDLAPHTGWSVLAVAGFLGWVSAAAGFFFKGFKEDGRFDSARGLKWSVGIAIGYLCWIVGLMKA